MKTTPNQFVPKSDLKTFNDIDGLLVIRELLKFKGSEIVSPSKQVRFKPLEDMALIVYNLKASPTNRLYVGHHLLKYYRKAGLVEQLDFVTVPNDVLSDAMEEEVQFRK